MKPSHKVLAYLLFALSFIVIGHHYQSLQALLQTKISEIFVFDFSLIVIDGWTMLHIFMYTLMGYWMPQKSLHFLTLGVLFEILEDYMASNGSTQLVSCSNQLKTFWCHTPSTWPSSDGYWYAKWGDIIFNMLGYKLGEYLFVYKYPNVETRGACF